MGWRGFQWPARHRRSGLAPPLGELSPKVTERVFIAAIIYKFILTFCPAAVNRGYPQFFDLRTSAICYFISASIYYLPGQQLAVHAGYAHLLYAAAQLLTRRFDAQIGVAVAAEAVALRRLEEYRQRLA